MKIVKYKKLSQSYIFIWLQLLYMMYGVNLHQLKKKYFINTLQTNYKLKLVVKLNKYVKLLSLVVIFKTEKKYSELHFI